MSTILVTGGAGFIGFHTCQRLLERGDNIVLVDNFSDYYDVSLKEGRLQELKNISQSVSDGGDLVVYKEDISDENAMKNIFSSHEIDKVCHLAAQAGVRYSLNHPLLYEQSNVRGSLVLFELAHQFDVDHVVFASSSSVYGNNTKVPFSEDDPVTKPISVYAATKRSTELLAHAYHHLYDMHFTGLRFFTVYGPWGRPDMAYFSFTQKILSGEEIVLFKGGKMQRDFTYVTDVVDGVLAALDTSLGYEIINLGNSSPIEVTELVTCIEKSCGVTAQVTVGDAQPGDVNQTYADVSKAKKLLGYSPQVSIQEGISHFVAWYKQHFDVK